jgi:hypothetical protein
MLMLSSHVSYISLTYAEIIAPAKNARILKLDRDSMTVLRSARSVNSFCYVPDTFSQIPLDIGIESLFKDRDGISIRCELPGSTELVKELSILNREQ